MNQSVGVSKLKNIEVLTDKIQWTVISLQKKTSCGKNINLILYTTFNRDRYWYWTINIYLLVFINLFIYIIIFYYHLPVNVIK